MAAGASGCATQRSDATAGEQGVVTFELGRDHWLTVYAPVLTAGEGGYLVSARLSAPNRMRSPERHPPPPPFSVRLVGRDGRAVEGTVEGSTMAGSVEVEGRGTFGFPATIPLDEVRRFVITIGEQRGAWEACGGEVLGTVVFNPGKLERPPR